MSLTDITAKGDGSLLLASVGLRDTDTKSGNPWHDPRTGQFANAPPGVKLIKGLAAMMKTSGKTKAFIEKRRQFTLPDSMAAGEVDGDNVKILFFREGELVDEFVVARDIDKAKLNQKLRERDEARAKETPKPDTSEDSVEQGRALDSLVGDMAEALDDLNPEAAVEPPALDPPVTGHRISTIDPYSFDRHPGLDAGGGNYRIDLNVDQWPNIHSAHVSVDPENFHRAKMGEGYPWFSLTVTYRDGTQGYDSFEQFHDMDEEGLKRSLDFLEGEAPKPEPHRPVRTSGKLKYVRRPVEGGVMGKSLPAYDVYDANGDKIGEIKQVLKRIREGGRVYATGYVKEWEVRDLVDRGVGSVRSFDHATEGLGAAKEYLASRHVARAGDVNEPELDFPTRLTQGWLEKTLPTLDEAGAKKLIAALRKKGWGDRKGSLTDRVYPHLTPEVQEALGVKPEPEIPKPPTFDRDVSTMHGGEVRDELKFFRENYRGVPSENPEEIRERIRALNKRLDQLKIEEIDEFANAIDGDFELLRDAEDEDLERILDLIESFGGPLPEHLELHQAIIDEQVRRVNARRREEEARERRREEERAQGLKGKDTLKEMMARVKQTVAEITSESMEGDREQRLTRTKELLKDFVTLLANEQEGPHAFIGTLRLDLSGSALSSNAVAHADWQGNIVMRPAYWERYEQMAAKVARGDAITTDEAFAFQVLIHEAHHLAMNGDLRKLRASGQYAQAAGKLLEESMVESLGRHHTTELLAGLGVQLRSVWGNQMRPVTTDTDTLDAMPGSYNAEVKWLRKTWLDPYERALRKDLIKPFVITDVGNRNIGKRVRVNRPGQLEHGEEGIIEDVMQRSSGSFVVTVRLNNGRSTVIQSDVWDEIVSDPSGLSAIEARRESMRMLKKIHWSNAGNTDRLVALHEAAREVGFEFDPKGERMGSNFTPEIMHEFKIRTASKEQFGPRLGSPRDIINAIDNVPELEDYIKELKRRRLAAKKTADSFTAARMADDAATAKKEQKRWNEHLTHAKNRLALLQKNEDASRQQWEGHSDAELVEIERDFEEQLTIANLTERQRDTYESVVRELNRRRRLRRTSTASEDADASVAPEHSPRLATPEEVKALKLPPAWRDVMIYDTPTKGGLKAFGFDAKGRKQYRYDSEVVAKKSQAKFQRVQVVAKKADGIVRQMRKDAPGDDTAAALLLIALSGFRIGSDADTGAKVKAYGTTTLTSEHVRIEGDKMHFDFIGKKGVRIRQTVQDKQLADLLRDREGRLFDTTNTRVRAYLRRQDKRFLPKDFRTHTANLEAERIVASLPLPASPEEAEKMKMLVARGVAAKLGNTPSVALTNYIDPRVFSAWEVDVPGSASEAPEPSGALAVGQIVDVGRASGQPGDLGVITRIDERGAWVTSFNNDFGRSSSIQWGDEWLDRVDVPDVIDDGLATVVFDQHYEAWGASLSAEEVEAFKLYRNTKGFEAINSFLRFDAKGDARKGEIPESQVTKAIEEMDRAMERAPVSGVDADLTVFRGVGSIRSVLRDKKVGDIFEDAGYSSTTTDERTAEDYSTGSVFTIRVPAGSKGAWMRANAELEDFRTGNNEFVLPRGSRFEIVSIDRKNSNVEMRLVGSTDADRDNIADDRE